MHLTQELPLHVLADSLWTSSLALAAVQQRETYHDYIMAYIMVLHTLWYVYHTSAALFTMVLGKVKSSEMIVNWKWSFGGSF